MARSIRAVLSRLAHSYVLFVVLGVVVGLALVPVAWEVASEPEGTVAVVHVEGTIDGVSTTAVTDQLRELREDPDVDAVVIVSNSGGGAATSSEELYLSVKRTAAEKPVVASVGATAASGAYYTIAPSDYIFAKPSSIVGSVGVRSTVPQDVEPNDAFATTGPDKLTGADEREFYAILESLRLAFLNAVYEQRGDTLRLSRAELSEAKIYSGSQAVENGLADELGDREAAVAHAAALAGVERYDTVELRANETPPTFVSRSNYLASDAPEKRLIGTDYLTGDPTSTPTFLMLWGGDVDQTAPVESPTNSTTSTGSDSHSAASPETDSNRTGVTDASR
ncbi:MAG: S49 family peptidase [Halobacteriota archaeon]